MKIKMKIKIKIIQAKIKLKLFQAISYLYKLHKINDNLFQFNSIKNK